LNKLFFADLLLILLTFLGTSYLWFNTDTEKSLLGFILLFYIFSKIIGYWILPYAKFEVFINKLSSESKFYKLSGFEIFKTCLVTLLFIGFIFFHPIFWFFESILIIMMRVWGISFIKNLEQYNEET